MTVPGISFQVLDGREAAGCEDEMRTLHAEIYAADEGDYPRRLRVWRRQPGFALAAARHGGYLVGAACGMTLRPSTSWWSDLTAPLPDDITDEHPGRTFALTDLAVRASWRRQGIAEALYGLLLQGRAEERATLTVPPDATAAQRAFRNWGWQKVARSRAPGPGAPVLDVLVIPLPR